MSHRPPDPVFDPTEYLYRRIDPKWLLEDGELSPAYVEFPAFSVNRAKYSVPRDILAGYPGHHVGQFQVRDIPSPMTSSESGRGPTTTYSWAVEHLPECDNYAHSEVRTYRNEEYTKSRVKSKTIKNNFRLELQARLRIISPIQ